MGRGLMAYESKRKLVEQFLNEGETTEKVKVELPERKNLTWVSPGTV